MPVSDLVPIPKSTAKATELASLLCAGGTALGGVRSANLKPGQWLCVPGAAGGVGGLAVQYGKHFGYCVVAIDSNKKEKHCMELGLMSLSTMKKIQLLFDVSKRLQMGVYTELLSAVHRLPRIR